MSASLRNNLVDIDSPHADAAKEISEQLKQAIDADPLLTLTLTVRLKNGKAGVPQNSGPTSE